VQRTKAPPGFNGEDSRFGEDTMRPFRLQASACSAHKAQGRLARLVCDRAAAQAGPFLRGGGALSTASGSLAHAVRGAGAGSTGFALPSWVLGVGK
jgi:hypothetical protein